MRSFFVSEIVWETDGVAVRLPREVVVECEDDDDIADALSDRYGWLVSDFQFHAVETE